MALIPEEKVEEVRQATDLVDLISRYVPDLRRSGSTLKAVCPFHREKTPSFHVWPDTQTWKCFGCGKGGSCFHFLMERERVTFPEAVRSLARDASIDLGPAEERGPGDGDRQRLLDLLEWTCRFFEAMLRAEAGRKAVEYCRFRRIEGETARTFRIGYAPGGWRTLADAAARKGWSEELLSKAGLVRPGRREPYDWFRDRLVFPIRDVRGRVVGFGGRSLDDTEPKYLNSPDTVLFKKGRMLYGLDLAREEALRDRRIGLVEGYTDVLMAHQHGIRWIVAGLGTGLTQDHATLVRRYADRVDLVYDADTAGARAAERALDVFLAVEADVRVAELPGGQDPCDYLLSHGREAFLAALSRGREVFDFLVARAGEKNDLGTLAGRIAAVDDVLQSVARTANAVKRDLLLARLADAFRISEASVRERLRLFEGRRDGVETGAGISPGTVEEAPAERLVIEAVVCRTELIDRLREDWPPDRFRHPVYRSIAQGVVDTPRGNGPVEAAAIVARLADPRAAETLATILAEGSGKRNLEIQFEDCLARLRRRAALEETENELERARELKNGEEMRRLERELFRLRSERR